MAVPDKVSSLTILTLKVTGLRVVILIDDTTVTDQTASFFISEPHVLIFKRKIVQ